MFSYYKKFYGKGIVCPICKSEMVLDDVDYNFDGNQNEYWICDKCDSSGYVKVRYGKPIKFPSFLLKSLSKRLHYKNAYVIIAAYLIDRRVI